MGRKTQSFCVVKETFVFPFSLPLPSFSLHSLCHFRKQELGLPDELEQTIACNLRCQALELTSLILSPWRVKPDFLLPVP